MSVTCSSWWKYWVPIKKGKNTLLLQALCLQEKSRVSQSLTPLHTRTHTHCLRWERLVYCSPAELWLGLFGTPVGAVQLLEGGRAANDSADGPAPPLPPEPPQAAAHTLKFLRSGTSKQPACAPLEYQNKTLQSYFSPNPFFFFLKKLFYFFCGNPLSFSQNVLRNVVYSKSIPQVLHNSLRAVSKYQNNHLVNWSALAHAGYK